MVENEPNDQALFPQRAGEILRAARIRAGLDIGDVATRTRIPLRRLEAIERGDHSDLPSPTYAIGFAKSFARAVSADPEVVATALRDELGHQQPGQRELADLDDFDPQRLPGRSLAWTAAIIAMVILGGYGVWRGWLMQDPAVADQATVATAAPSVPQPARPASSEASSPTEQVTLTARDAVWLRVYDNADKVLFEKEMAAGERYEVPRDATNPMIRTGRADLIAVSVDGRDVAALGPAERTIKDVGISAAALAARPADTSTTSLPAGNASAAP